MFRSWTPTERYYAHASRPGRLPAWIRLLLALALIAALCETLASAISPIAWVLAAPMTALALYYNGESVLTSLTEQPDAAAAPAVPAVPESKTVAYQQMREWHTEQLAELVGTCTQEQIAQVRTLLTRIERVWARLWVEHEALTGEQERIEADRPITSESARAAAEVARRRQVMVARADRLERLGRTLPERISTLAGGYTPDAVSEGLSLAMLETQVGIDQLAS
jgi:hypothetical protein